MSNIKLNGPLDIESISHGEDTVNWSNDIRLNMFKRRVDSKFTYVNIKSRRLNKADPFQMAIDKLFGDK